MRRRGQTLVVFALTLLLLVLMVTMTLSIGMKAKEKMELQTMADAAAYSNAVATARAFNGISLMNRALMGHMVAMTGVESLISWSSYYRAAIHGAKDAYTKGPLVAYGLILATCAPNVALCACATKAIADIKQTQSELEKEDSKIDSDLDWEGLDRKAGNEAKALQLGSIWEEQQKVYEQLTKKVIEPGLASSIVTQAKEGSRFPGELSALRSSVNKDELDGEWGCEGKGAACLRRDAGRKLHFIDAAMGSRGYSFVTGRGAGAAIQRKLKTVMNSQDTLVSVTNSGSGYFPNERANESHSGPTIDGTEVWGDDHGTVSIIFNRGQAPCPTSVPGAAGTEARVRSNHLDNHGDMHTWNGGGDTDADERHTMGKCTQCPGIWPSHMDYNYKLVTQEANNWGQPKTYAVIQRDYKARPGKLADPWNLLFRFRFSPNREGVEFDNRGVELSEANGGADISKATALSAGITYYKRAGDFWQEPPNFLNPFWRATLVSVHVDKDGKDKDVQKTLEGAASFTAEAYEALKKKGYEGW